MADKIELTVRISADGKVVIETRGLKGASCGAETEALEKALGTVLKREKTSEAYQVTGSTGVSGKAR